MQQRTMSLRKTWWQCLEVISITSKPIRWWRRSSIIYRATSRYRTRRKTTWRTNRTRYLTWWRRRKANTSTHLSKASRKDTARASASEYLQRRGTKWNSNWKGTDRIRRRYKSKYNLGNTDLRSRSSRPSAKESMPNCSSWVITQPSHQKVWRPHRTRTKLILVY